MDRPANKAEMDGEGRGPRNSTPLTYLRRVELRATQHVGVAVNVLALGGYKRRDCPATYTMGAAEKKLV